MTDINRYIDETFPDAARPIASLEAEVARLTAELAATQAEAAAMRAAIELMLDENSTHGECLAAAQAALSPDAGRGWLSPAEAERLTRERDQYKRMFDRAMNAADSVFQVDSNKPAPLLPDFLRLGASKLEGVVELAKAYIAKDAEIERLRSALAGMLVLHSPGGALEIVEDGPGGTTEELRALDRIDDATAAALAALNGKATP